MFWQTVLESELSLVRPESFVKRILMTLTGVFVCSISVGMFNLSAFGVDPFQCFAQGSHRPFSGYMSYGSYYLIISLIMLAGIFVWDKRYIGIATVINMFFTGYLVDYSYSVLVAWLPDPTLIQRALMLLVALVIMCFGSALYLHGESGRLGLRRDLADSRQAAHHSARLHRPVQMDSRGQ